jgi:hypothetical protein
MNNIKENIETKKNAHFLSKTTFYAYVRFDAG